MAFDLSNLHIEIASSIDEVQGLNWSSVPIATVTTGSTATFKITAASYYKAPTTLTIKNVSWKTYAYNPNAAVSTCTIVTDGNGDVTFSGSAVACTYSISASTNSIYRSVSASTWVGTYESENLTFTIGKTTDAGFKYPKSVTVPGACTVTFTPYSSVVKVSKLTQNTTLKVTETGYVDRGIIYSATGGMSKSSGTITAHALVPFTATFQNAAHYAVPTYSASYGSITSDSYDPDTRILSLTIEPDASAATVSVYASSNKSEYEFVVDDSSKVLWTYDGSSDLPGYLVVGSTYSFNVKATVGYALSGGIAITGATYKINSTGTWSSGHANDIEYYNIVISNATAPVTAHASNVYGRTWNVLDNINNGSVTKV